MKDILIKEDDEILVAKVRALTIANLLEEYANSIGEGVLPSSKRQAWNIAQNLRSQIRIDEAN